MSRLFSPYSIGPLTLKNRIVVAPMAQYSAIDGEANNWHLVHLGTLALSGAGLLVVEATAVEPDGRVTPDDLGLWSDATEAALRRVLAAVRECSTIPIALQLGHGGRKASSHAPWNSGALIAPEHGGWRPVAPSAVAHAAGESPPVALDGDGIQRIVAAFAASARRAQRAGVDAIELHAAHGYLLHEFLSPLANRRTDEYGGSLENRMRLPLAVFDAMRAAVPASLPLGIRISATDWVEGGWEIEQSVAFCRALRDRGCAYVHVSSGGVSTAQRIAVTPGYQIGLAERLRAQTGLPTIAVGLVTEPEQAEAIIARGQADLVALGRALLFNPRWPWHAAAKLGAQIEAPRQYWRSQPQGMTKLFGEVRIGHR